MAQEVDRLLQVIFAGRRQSGRLDLEAVEMATRAAVHRAGAVLLAEVLEPDGPGEREIPARVVEPPSTGSCDRSGF